MNGLDSHLGPRDDLDWTHTWDLEMNGMVLVHVHQIDERGHRRTKL